MKETNTETELIISEANATEDEVHQFTADAAELGIKPGERWPDQIRTTLGNRQQFYFHSKIMHEGSLISASYLQVCRCISLTIFND